MLTLVIIGTVLCGIGIIWNIIMAYCYEDSMAYVNSLLLEVVLGFSIFVMWYLYLN